MKKREGTEIKMYSSRSTWGLGSRWAKCHEKRSWQFISGSVELQRPQKPSLRGSTNLTWAYYL